MQSWMRTVALLLLGTSLVPPHWCCVFELEQAPCRTVHAASSVPPTRSCCAARMSAASCEDAAAEAFSGKPDRACCRAATAAVVVKATYVEQDHVTAFLPNVIAADAFIGNGHSLAGIESRPRGGPDLLTQICRLNC